MCEQRGGGVSNGTYGATQWRNALSQQLALSLAPKRFKSHLQSTPSEL